MVSLNPRLIEVAPSILCGDGERSGTDILLLVTGKGAAISCWRDGFYPLLLFALIYLSFFINP